ncbi:MAG TPA: hypothetical protein VE053_09490 [Allosphingosinicella sp.]|nr:hypothetical protein [Allosphingosinicella sp.]
MEDIWTETVAILFTSLGIAGLASLLILFRPAARRRRRHKRHSRRPKIDLMRHEPSGPATEADA